jgi:hypothetical protein
MYVFFIFSSHLFIDRLYIFFIYLIGAMDMVWIKINNISSSERPRLGMLPLEVAGSLELGSLLTALPLTAHGSSTSHDLIPCMPAFSSAPPRVARHLKSGPTLAHCPCAAHASCYVLSFCVRLNAYWRNGMSCCSNCSMKNLTLFCKLRLHCVL